MDVASIDFLKTPEIGQSVLCENMYQHVFSHFTMNLIELSPCRDMCGGDLFNISIMMQRLNPAHYSSPQICPQIALTNDLDR